MSIYRPHAITSHADSQGALVAIPGTTGTDIQVNAEMLAELTAAATRPQHTAIVKIAPVFSGETFSLATVLGIVGSTGLGIDSDSNPGWAAYLAKLNDFGDVASGSVHRQYLVKKGVWIPKQLSCDHAGNAKLTWECYAIQKGSNLPIIYSDTTALPTVTIPLAKWTLGPIDLAGVVLSDYNQITIDFGLTINPDSVQSDIYPKYIGVKNNIPIVTIQGIDPQWWASAVVPLNGVAVTHANSNLYLRKRTQDGAHFVANNVAEHIKFTFAGIAVVDSVNSQTDSAATTSLRVQSAEDSSGNAPIIVDTASAIT